MLEESGITVAPPPRTCSDIQSHFPPPPTISSTQKRRSDKPDNDQDDNDKKDDGSHNKEDDSGDDKEDDSSNDDSNSKNSSNDHDGNSNNTNDEDTNNINNDEDANDSNIVSNSSDRNNNGKEVENEINIATGTENLPLAQGKLFYSIRKYYLIYETSDMVSSSRVAAGIQHLGEGNVIYLILLKHIGIKNFRCYHCHRKSTFGPR